jgi:ribose transport system permease protein
VTGRAGRRVQLPASTARILLVLAAIYLLFGLISPDHVFLTLDNLRNVSIAAAETLILATGLTFLIVAGQLDLSVGSQLVLGAVAGAAVMHRLDGRPVGLVLVLGILATLAVTCVYGLVNGLLTVRLRVPSFVVTLGTLGMGLGISQVLTAAGGSTSQPAPVALADFGLSTLAGIPSVVLVAAAVAAVLGLVLANTRFGLRCYAVGSNADAARRAGVPAGAVVVRAFVLMGLLSGVAAVVDLARFSSVSVATHQQDNLTAIAAVIIGGASLYGGRGTLFGTVVGTLIPVVLLQGFVIQNVNPYWQNVAIGTVLIAAVAVDQIERTNRRVRTEAAAAGQDDPRSAGSPAEPAPAQQGVAR